MALILEGKGHPYGKPIFGGLDVPFVAWKKMKVFSMGAKTET